jgi:hypothetical protein
MCVLWRQMVNVLYRQATLHLNIFQFLLLLLFFWHLYIKHIEEVSTYSIGKLTIYQTDRVVRSFSTGGANQENRKGYNKCVNTSQVERLMSKRRKRIDHHLVITIPKLTDCSITKRRHDNIYIHRQKTTTGLFNGLQRECDAILFWRSYYRHKVMLIRWNEWEKNNLSVFITTNWKFLQTFFFSLQI